MLVKFVFNGSQNLFKLKCWFQTFFLKSVARKRKKGGGVRGEKEEGGEERGEEEGDKQENKDDEEQFFIDLVQQK